MIVLKTDPLHGARLLLKCEGGPAGFPPSSALQGMIAFGASRAVSAAKAERPSWIRKRSSAADDWCSASDGWGGTQLIFYASVRPHGG